MIIKYRRYNENMDEINPNDRVITHGDMRYWGDQGEYKVSIEDQTGIICEVKQGAFRFYGVVFDNYFFPQLTDLDRNIKFRRGLWIGMDQLEKIETKVYRDEKPISFSKEVKLLFDHCEYVDCPFWLNIDYIDITDKNDVISFISKDRLDRLKWDDDQWNNNYRQEMRVGRFIQIINPYTDPKSLEKKVNLFKAAYNGLIAKKSVFKIIKGQEIYHWYDERNYQDGTGTLNKSCMRDKLERLSLYTNNPNKVSLLILVNEEGKLEGRSLIWQVDDPDVTYMDRAYTIYQEDTNRFEDYAKVSGWKYHGFYQYHPMRVFLDKNIGSPENNPFMDTFKYFIVKGEYGKCYLSNRFNDIDNFEELDYI